MNTKLSYSVTFISILSTEWFPDFFPDPNKSWKESLIKNCVTDKGKHTYT